MTAPLSRIAPRLAKLLPMLASDHAGEVVATAQAMTRTLTGAGLDWHALAALVGAEAGRAEAPPFTFASLAPRSARKSIAVLARSPVPTPLERARMGAMRAALAAGPKARLTADQTAFLDALWRKAFGG